MSPENTSAPTQICPTCGTRVAADSARCLVCGADLGGPVQPVRKAKTTQGFQMPEITLSLPVALLLLALFLAIGALLVYFALSSQTDIIVQPPTETVTVTITVTPTLTPTEAPPTITSTPLPSPTPLTHVVRSNEYCTTLAAFYDVSVQSIIQLNNLDTGCGIYENQRLLIPQPTPTVTPLPSATLSPAEQTEEACQKVIHEVASTDTLGGIAATYDVPMAAIKEYNGLTSDTVFEGQSLTIPLCRRFATPGPTPTATLPPPYPAPSLLLPADGAGFPSSTNTITLQWAAVGALRSDEVYLVTVEDVTAASGDRLEAYVTDTKYLVPAEWRPKESTAHIFRWRVTVMRQVGTDSNGKPVYDSAGAVSASRVFAWTGTP